MSPAAIAPNSLRVPVPTMTPDPDPPCTTVPISAHEVSSAKDTAADTGATDLATGTDSPVSTDSSHSRPVVVSRRRSAGTMSPSCRCTMSPGTNSRTSTRMGTPPRVTRAVFRICECSASAARSARNSLAKPSPTDNTTMTPMITASDRSPTKYEAVAAATSRASSGERTCRVRTARMPTWWDATTLLPNRSRLADACCVVSPSGPTPRRRATSSAERLAASAMSSPGSAGVSSAGSRAGSAALMSIRTIFSVLRRTRAGPSRWSRSARALCPDLAGDRMLPTPTAPQPRSQCGRRVTARSARGGRRPG